MLTLQVVPVNPASQLQVKPLTPSVQLPSFSQRPKMTEQSVFEKLKKEEKAMTGPGQPLTFSHSIYTQMLTGVYDTRWSVFLFSCIFIPRMTYYHVYSVNKILILPTHMAFTILYVGQSWHQCCYDMSYIVAIRI